MWGMTRLTEEGFVVGATSKQILLAVYWAGPLAVNVLHQGGMVYAFFREAAVEVRTRPPDVYSGHNSHCEAIEPLGNRKAPLYENAW